MKILKFTLLALVVAIAACSNDEDSSDDMPTGNDKPMVWECEGTDSCYWASSHTFQVPVSGGEYFLRCINHSTWICDFDVSTDSTLSEFKHYGKFCKKSDDSQDYELTSFKTGSGALYPANDKEDICKWFSIEPQNYKEYKVIVNENEGHERAINITFESGNVFCHATFKQEGK